MIEEGGKDWRGYQLTFLTDLIKRTRHFRIDGQVNLVIIVSQKSNNQIILQLIKI